MNLEQLHEAMRRSFRTRQLAPLDEQIAEDAIRVMGGRAADVPAAHLADRLRNLGTDLTALADTLTD